MIPDARLDETDVDLVPSTAGWFVLNARDACWFDKPTQGHSVPLTGNDEYEVETFCRDARHGIRVVSPGEPTRTYRCETE